MKEKKTKVQPTVHGLFDSSFLTNQTLLPKLKTNSPDMLLKAIYSGNLKTVQNIESTLQYAELKEQWIKIDARNAIEHIENLIPKDLSTNSSYKELGEWYSTNEAMPWIESYDNACLFHEGLIHWNENQWVNRIKLYPEVLLHGWFQPGSECVIAPKTCLETNYNEKTSIKLLMAPSREVHDNVVKLIREELLELKYHVEIYAGGMDCASTGISL
ncbi:MAG: hypothetical protein H0T84_00160 [Tatlockia sp.]|nr:hypothetical protein [Tatlockia sp.]